ncbi:MAG: P1 family peptidase [Acidobacteria bacterium]|nr:P1 family peptidase [Acidobacteriota bacterium]
MPAGFGPIAGLKIGHAQDEAALTGCTVFVCEQGMVAACEVLGGAVGERELETLRPGHIVERIHGLVLVGGSAFGLDAASGVMRWCEERGVGFDAGVVRVPIVPSAILFDLAVGSATRRPDAAMGYAAAQAAVEGPVEEGNAGAGTGATVGKLFGIERAIKAGIGCWTEELPGGVRVAALAVVNAFSDIREPETGRIIAGARAAADSMEFVDTAAAMRRGPEAPGVRAGFSGTNTVLVVVATDASLTKMEAQRVAGTASEGMARTVSPAFTKFDGDIVFALSLGDKKADVDAVGAAAAEAVARAIVRGVTEARTAGGVPGLKGRE